MNRTRIESEAIGALLDRGSLNHRFQQGLDPCSGTLNHPAPHVPAQALVITPTPAMIEVLLSKCPFSGV